MGTLGGPELVAIFILGLLIFGPKELPKLGRTICKALAEFRRAQNEMKATFQREMNNLERETNLRELTSTDYTADNYVYGDPGSHNYYSELPENGYSSETTYDASAIPGAVTEGEPYQIEAASGTVPSGHLEDHGTPEVHAAPGAVHSEHGTASEPVTPAAG